MLRFLRIKLLPTVLLNVLVATLISGGPWDTALTILLLIQGACLYFFGMALNDRLDVERDRENAANGLQPPRPLVSGEISLKTADRLIGLSLLGALFTAAGIYLMRGDAAAKGLLFSAGTLGSILLYNCAFKFVPLLGPLCMGLVRGLLIFSSTTLYLGSIPEWNSLATLHAVTMTIYIFAVTHFSMEEERSRPAALKVRKAGVVFAFTLPFLYTYLFGKGDLGSTVLALYLHGLLFSFLLQVKKTPPLSPQRTTFLFLSLMTWIDFNFLWSWACEHLFIDSPHQVQSGTAATLSIVGLPLWIILWFLWVIFGLGFRDRTLQSPPQNS